MSEKKQEVSAKDLECDQTFKMFAAAALTGLLASGKWDVKQCEDEYVKHSLSIAATMTAAIIEE